MKELNIATLVAQLDELLKRLRTDLGEVRYGDPQHRAGKSNDAIVIRWTNAFGMKYVVKQVNRLGQEGSGAYFWPHEDMQMRDHVFQLVMTHHKPHSSPAVRKFLEERQSEMPNMHFYGVERFARLEDEEDAQGKLTVEEVFPGELL